jgi:hypothetical protein
MLFALLAYTSMLEPLDAFDQLGVDVPPSGQARAHARAYH